MAAARLSTAQSSRPRLCLSRCVVLVCGCEPTGEGAKQSCGRRALPASRVGCGADVQIAGPHRGPEEVAAVESWNGSMVHFSVAVWTRVDFVFVLLFVLRWMNVTMDERSVAMWLSTIISSHSVCEAGDYMYLSEEKNNHQSPRYHYSLHQLSFTSNM
jgi:hypothetical protein